MAIKKDAAFWLHELKIAGKHEKKWRVRARKVIERYRDDDPNDEQHFNILWSNTQTQRPALYSSTPKPVVKRRHRQEGGVFRDMAHMMERALEYTLDPGGSYDFDRVGEKLILDYLLPGRMVARVKYHPLISTRTEIVESETAPEGVELQMNEDGKFLHEAKFDELVDEEVRAYHIPWDQYRQSVADCWDDVWWVAYGNNFLTREEIIEQFGDEHADVPLKHISHQEDGRKGQEPDEERTVKKAQVWEIWDKDDRKVCAVIEGYDKLLMSQDDPLNLRGFYPQPEPVMIVETPDSLLPIPEYAMYQFQAEELNKVTSRIDKLVDGMKLVGLYPGSQKDAMDQLLKSAENTLIPVEDWSAITERGGLKGMIEWVPLRDVADTWQRLMMYRQDMIAQIFELTGISDIQRGSTDPRETKGAQQIKASFAGRRLLPKQQDTQRFFRDLFRLKAEIIAEHFQTDTIVKMANIEMTPQVEQARELLKDDALRSFVIDIETDSTIAPDEAMDKQGVAEFTAALSQMLGQVFPIVQAQPAAMGPLGKMILWMTRKFRIAREAEDELEEFLQAFNELPDNTNKEAEAKAAEKQAEMQLKQQQAQAELQLKQQQAQAEDQRKQQELNAQIQRENAKADLENQKTLLEIEEKREKIRLMREEAEAKLMLKAVDDQAKRLSTQQQAASKPVEATPQIALQPAEDVKSKKIRLITDSDGKVSGAEIRPVEPKRNVRFNRNADDKIESADVE